MSAVTRAVPTQCVWAAVVLLTLVTVDVVGSLWITHSLAREAVMTQTLPGAPATLFGR